MTLRRGDSRYAATMRCTLWLVAAFAFALFGAACKRDTRKGNTGERDYVEGEVRKLKDALAKRVETEVVVGCISTTTSLPRLPRELADEIEQLCYVDAPKLHLENAIADARKQKAGAPELGDLACMQLFAADAFKAIAARPPTDPALKALVEEYTKLCPAAVAKLRAKATPPPAK